MAATHPLLLLVAAVLAAGCGAVAATASGNGTTSTPTAYEMLERYDFPRGILPVGVEGYVLREDGSFEVYFPRDCEFMLARTWLVRYGARIAGAAASGSLTSLQGVYVKVLFVWLPVGEVDRAGDKLSFYIGPVSTSFPLADFADSPRCRGYDLAATAAAAL
ncbi:hypothetical protein E2562_016067 [Oryza meyeriana var. granulata]|uniref:DUF538 family protein n=1 Tax=Oryza meyeriana var. granulata TaxID=110450 RepID=A0A6G1BKZ6_9ORYZ|nr:hypothetical protein E2562_016067 [Oryza meyeriana var. granulata]